MHTNDIGESLEVVKFHPAALDICARWVSEKGYFSVPDYDHYVLAFAIADAILVAVKAEREACAKIASESCDYVIDVSECSTHQQILSRNDTESE